MNKSSVASFDLDTVGRYVDGEFAVYPHSLLFKAGTYADKDFAMSAEELLAAVEGFQPVGGNVEHSDFLRDRACEVRSVYVDEQDNTILRGVVAVPTWLDEQLSSAERKLSCEWDRATKMLCGVGLVVHPRIEEAALMSAYANFARPRHDTPTGQRHLQHIHDLSVERGATCKTSATMSQFASTHEARAIQQVHDMTTEHGAQCEKAMSDEDRNRMSAPLLYSGEKTKERKRGMNIDFKALFSGLFAAAEERENTPAPPAAPVAAPVLEPSRAQDVGTFTAQHGAGGAVPVIPAVTGAPLLPHTAPTAVAPDPRVAELEKQLAERDATIAKEAEARIQREASIFAEEQVRAQKAAPSEQEKLAAAFAQAMRDDQRHDAVTFGEGDQKVTTSRVQQLRDVYEARPAGVLTQQLLPDGQNAAQVAAMFNQQQTDRVGPDGKKVEGQLSAERRRQLLEGSSLGRAIVREAPKNGHGSS